MEIRPLTPAERPALLAIRRELFPDDEPDWPADEYLTPGGIAVGAFDDDELIGYAAAGLRSHAEGAWERPPAEQKIAYLEEWYVRAGSRGRGIGRALVTAVEAWAVELRATHLASDTEVDNTGAIAAHAAVGFRHVETAAHFLKALDGGLAADLTGSDVVELRELDEHAGRAVMRLRVAPAQLRFVAPNDVSLAQAFLTDDVWVRGVFAGDLPVGFAMLSTRDRRYYLWRFMIDHRFQGRGYGRRAMELIIDEVRAMPEADRLYLSYVPKPGGPEGFYKGLGFVETGTTHGGEVEAVLELRRQPPNDP